MSSRLILVPFCSLESLENDIVLKGREGGIVLESLIFNLKIRMQTHGSFAKEEELFVWITQDKAHPFPCGRELEKVEDFIILLIAQLENTGKCNERYTRHFIRKKSEYGL